MSDLENKVNPLVWNVPITNKDGTPTNEFMRKWAQQADTNGAIPDLTTASGVSAVLDKLGLAQGDILYRDTQLWKVLAPGTLGYVLQTEGAGANPAWAGISALIDLLGATQGEILYRNGTAWTVLAPGTNGQLLSYSTSSHAPQWSSISGVVLGSGVPSALYPAGTLYSRTDAAGVYSSQPTTSAPFIVQHASFVETTSTPGSVTLSGAPSPGNLLLAFIPFGNNSSAQPTVNTSKWTQFITAAGSGGNIRGFALYRYAQAGDTAALPAFCTAGSDYWAAAVYEIGAVSGTFSSDVPLSEGAGQTGSATQTTTGQLTVNTNDLGIIAGGNYDGSSNPTISAGWTSDESQNNAGNFGSVVAGHQVVVSPTTISGTLTFNNSAHSVTAFQCIVANLASLVAGWTLIGPAPAAPTGANPTATAGPAATNGSASTFMRSDAAPAVQKASSSQFGIVEVDNTTITAASGVISATAQEVSTRQVLTSGTTYTTAAGTRQLRIRMLGGGGGGGGGGSSGGGNAGAGSTTSFNSITAGGGNGGGGNGNPGGGTSGTGTASYRVVGGNGVSGTFGLTAAFQAVGGDAADGPFGGGGNGGTGVGGAGAANSGAGGGGGSGPVAAGAVGGGGGGAGEYVELIINSPTATYTYSIGSGGTAGTAGSSGGAGGAGGTGIIIVDELY